MSRLSINVYANHKRKVGHLNMWLQGKKIIENGETKLPIRNIYQNLNGPLLSSHAEQRTQYVSWKILNDSIKSIQLWGVSALYPQIGDKLKRNLYMDM